MNLTEVVQWMMQEGFMVIVQKKYVVTAKFNQEMKGVKSGLKMVGNLPVMSTGVPAVIRKDGLTDWAQTFLEFIKTAQVPSRGESRDGSYDLNKYSEPAMKTYRKLIEKEGIIPELLAKSTFLYYQTHRQYPVAIGRYIEEGLWRTDYMALLESGRDGTVAEHIQAEISKGTDFNHYELV